MMRVSHLSLWALMIGITMSSSLKLAPASATENEVYLLAASKPVPWHRRSSWEIEGLSTKAKTKSVQVDTPSAPPNTKAKSPCDWNDFEWDEMKPSEKKAWTKLGWNRTRWDAGIAPASDRKDWDQLTDSEKDAAKSLGITAKTWDSGC